MRNRKALAIALILTLAFFGTVISTLHLRPPALRVHALGNWLAGWRYRNKLTIDSALIDESLTDFPVLVKLSSTVFNFSNTQENGEDIRFTSSDGTTLLKHEFEYWNKTSEKAEIWVKIPLVSSTSDTDFYLYHENPAATDGQDPTNVWDSSYVMVQHMNDHNNTHILDSTTNNYDGTKKAANEPTEITDGQINSAQNFDGNDYIRCKDINEVDSTTQLTISIWANMSGNGPLISKYIDTNHRTHIYHHNGTIYWNLSNETANYAESASLTGWHQYAMVFNGSETGNENRLKCYVDGVQQSLTFTGTIPTKTADTGTNHLELGRQGTTYFTGQLDEARISNTPRTPAWIKAEHNSETDSLLTYGTEESIQWQYSMKMLFDNSAVTEDLVDFPVMINLSRAGLYFWDHVSPNHEDLRFVDADNVTDLYFEVEYWNYVEQKAYVWVKIPRIDAASTTDHIYVQFGHESPPESLYDDAAEVWDASYLMVQHMNDHNNTHILDSTTNNYDGTKKAANEPTEITDGQINSAQNFDGNDYIRCKDINEVDSTTQLTISIWANMSGNGPLISKYIDTNHRTHIYHHNGDIYWNLSNDTANFGTSSSLTGWHQYAMVFNGSETGNENRLKCYVDGVQQSLTFTGTIPTKTADTGTNHLELGRQGTTYFTGQLDEARISNTPRTPAWIKAEHLSTADQYITYEHVVAVLDSPTPTPTNKTLLCLSAANEPALKANISVRIRNEGSITEKINVIIYLIDENDTQTPAVGNLTVLNVSPGETRSVLVPIWVECNTDINCGFHKIKTLVEVLNDTCPNYAEATTTSSILRISITGDIASRSPEGFPLRGIPDGSVNMLDIAVLARDFGCECGHPKYIANCDILYDLKIDMRDLAVACKHFGETSP